MFCCYMMLVFLEKINSHTLLYLKWIATESYRTKQIAIPIGPDDVCDCIYHKLSEIKDVLVEIELPLRRWSMKRHANIADAIEESLIEEGDDPKYEPSEEESDDTDDIDCEDFPSAGLKTRPSVASKKKSGR